MGFCEEMPTLPILIPKSSKEARNTCPPAEGALYMEAAQATHISRLQILGMCRASKDKISLVSYVETL